MSNLLTTVSSIYEAFGRGDIPGVLTYLADDVRWEDWADNAAQKAEVPWLKFRQGKDGVQDFFQVIGSLTIKDFQILSLLTGGNQVAAEILFEAEVPATGKRYRDEEIHLWTFNDAGKVIRFRHYVDTAKHIAAMQG